MKKVLLLLALAACQAPVPTTDPAAGLELQIRERILDQLPESDGMRVQVAVEDGIVRLSGRVRHPASKDHAVALARQVEGIRLVEDAIEIDERMSKADP